MSTSLKCKCVKILPSQYGVIRCVCARRLSGGQRHEPPNRWIRGLFHGASFFLKLELVVWNKKPRGLIRGAPRESTGDIWNVFGRFQLLFMQGFLWNAGIGWTIPNRNSCECLPLIKTPLLHKHSPSCSNRFANLILKHFSVPIVAQTSWRGPRAFSFLTSWPSAAFAVQRKTQESSVAYWKVIFINWTSLECQYFSWWHIGSCLHCLRWSNLSNCSLLRPNTIRKKFLFPLPACFC